MSATTGASTQLDGPVEVLQTGWSRAERRLRQADRPGRGRLVPHCREHGARYSQLAPRPCLSSRPADRPPRSARSDDRDRRGL